LKLQRDDEADDAEGDAARNGEPTERISSSRYGSPHYYNDVKVFLIRWSDELDDLRTR
jgi:hypothetical protein